MNRRVLTASLVVVVAALALVFHFRPAHRRGGAAPDAAATDPRDAPRAPRSARGPDASGPRTGPAGPRPPERTVRDRALRDELRARIFAAWTAGLQALPDVRPDPLHAPMPERDGGGVDPDYLRERVREDFLPMAQGCYEQLLGRHPGLGGRVAMTFTIVGDERVGGVVDEVSLDAGDGGLADPDFGTCMRESMMAMAFRPPPRSGRVTVRYPFHLTPDTPDAN